MGTIECRDRPGDELEIGSDERATATAFEIDAHFQELTHACRCSSGDRRSCDVLVRPCRLGPQRTATATSRGRGTDTVGVVSVASNSDEPVGLTVLPPDEALLRTLLVPTAEELEIEGLTDEEWDAFEQALAAR